MPVGLLSNRAFRYSDVCWGFQTKLRWKLGNTTSRRPAMVSHSFTVRLSYVGGVLKTDILCLSRNVVGLGIRCSHRI